jgi:hypothetical protein
MGGMGRLGSVSGQGAFQGQGSVTGSLNKPNVHPVAGAVKQGSAVTGTAAESAGNVSKTATASAAATAPVASATGSVESTVAASKAAASSASVPQVQQPAQLPQPGVNLGAAASPSVDVQASPTAHNP